MKTNFPRSSPFLRLQNQSWKIYASEERSLSMSITPFRNFRSVFHERVFATAHENVFFRGELQDDRCKKKACHGDEKQTRSYHDHAIPPFLHLASICWHKLRASRLPQPHVNGLRVHRVECQEEDLGDQCDQAEVTFEGSKPNYHEKSQARKQTKNPKDGHACVCYLVDMS